MNDIEVHTRKVTIGVIADKSKEIKTIIPMLNYSDMDIVMLDNRNVCGLNLDKLLIVDKPGGDIESRMAHLISYAKMDLIRSHVRSGSQIIKLEVQIS